MAIPFLNNIDLRNNEIQNVRLQNAGTVNAANGQIFFNTGVNLAQYYANAIDTWVSLKEYSFGNGTYIDNTATGTAAKPIITPDLSAVDGTAVASERYLTKTNKWAEISTIPGTYSWSIQGDQGFPLSTVASGDSIDFSGGTNINTALTSGYTLTVNLNPSVTLAGQLTVNGAAQNSFAGQVTIPILPVAGTDAASKDYVDNAVVGGLIYQGGYNATTNTPNLETPSPNLIKKGWTYTVTADGLFFTEQVRVGDVLIAESDAPTALTDWTTVQNNIDLASLTQVGIGNVNAGTGISVAYTAGTATVTNTETNTNNTYAETITDTDTIAHNLGTEDVIIQLYDVTTKETIYADVDRVSTNTATITFSTTPTNSVRVLVQKIG